MVHIVKRLLSDVMMFVQGETTEAGLRQNLRQDAIPVVFDEIESQSEKATSRVNSIMDLMTIASSETGAKLVKGGANGQAQSFLIRSMFCFSSITVNLKQHAAKTRVTVLDMKPKPANETEADLAQYNGMLERIFETLTPDYISRLQARAVSLIPVIRHNARVFAEAAALSIGSRRFGDQVGTLIAGAYALHSTKKITPEAAGNGSRLRTGTNTTTVSSRRTKPPACNSFSASRYGSTAIKGRRLDLSASWSNSRPGGGRQTKRFPTSSRPIRFAATA